LQQQEAMKNKTAAQTKTLRSAKPEKNILRKNVSPAKEKNYKNKRRVDSFTDVNDRFRESREYNKMSQADWAKALGIHLSMVNAIEYKRVTPNISVLRAWKKVARVTYAYIIDGEKILDGETKGGN
jgi:ribosome-binding protein aMBF1 (putative translation factor)